MSLIGAKSTPIFAPGVAPLFAIGAVAEGGVRVLSERTSLGFTVRTGDDGLPVMAFADLMDHLGTLARNHLSAPLQDNRSIILYASPTRLQEAAFHRLKELGLRAALYCQAD